jgi:tetratricopeptide (TPR) repeat protein
MAESSRIDELRRRVQLDPASIAFAALAEEYRRAGQFEDAIATCEAGLQRHPAYLSARVTLGRSLLETGRYDEARTELEHVLKAAPENLAAIRGLAEIHHRTGELPEALEHYRSGSAALAEPAAAAVERAVAAPPLPAAPIPIAAAEAPAPRVAIAVTREAAPAPPPRPAPHPDQAALPALEAFLAAIVRAKRSEARTPSRR